MGVRANCGPGLPAPVLCLVTDRRICDGDCDELLSVFGERWMAA